MSTGFNDPTASAEIGIPSTTKKGFGFVIVPTPRILIEGGAPGVPEFAITLTPAVLPCNAASTPETAALDNSSAETEATAPVKSLF